MNTDHKPLSYISLFSSGGVGDLGFRDQDFYCVASAELISRRLEVQRINRIAEEQRLICGDLLLPGKLNEVINLAEDFMRNNKTPITTVIATPPCQGMSVANHKKGNELERNSLVVRSIEIIQKIKPLTFVFENVPSFINTACTGLDGSTKTIGEEIEQELGGEYEYFSRTVQFSQYGSPSSRKRSLTIGIRNDITWVNPLDIFPDSREAPTLQQLIGHLPRLENMGECSSNDILHAFRPYEERMRSWIRDLAPGQSAFDNPDPEKRPHRIINGQRVPNVRKNGDKYRRVPWDGIAPCVHTRNDILASQNTVHPEDDRVFSIRELMLMMGIPEDFIWYEGQSLKEDPNLSLLKKNAVNIRQCLGEAVPVPITKSMAAKIKLHVAQHIRYSKCQPKRKTESDWTTDAQKAAYVPLSNERKKLYSAYYTEPLVAFAVAKRSLKPHLGKKKAIKILEPSAGSGVFLEVLNQFARFHPLELTAIELDHSIVETLDSRWSKPNNFSLLTIMAADYLRFDFQTSFDLIIGNPPFGRRALDPDSKWGTDAEISVRFIRKALADANALAFVLPKALLHASYYLPIRKDILQSTAVSTIIDMGEYTFSDVKVETICLHLAKEKDHVAKPLIEIKSWPQNVRFDREASYILDPSFPTWLLYRNDRFDYTLSNVQTGVFSAWRDRSISRKHQTFEDQSVRVLRGRNISRTGEITEDQRDYRISKLQSEPVERILASLEGSVKFLAPNLSYYPRVARFNDVAEGIPEGSCAVLHADILPQQADLFYDFTRSKEFAEFYRIACNFATRSINIDSALIYWWAVPKTRFFDSMNCDK